MTEKNKEKIKKGKKKKIVKRIKPPSITAKKYNLLWEKYQETQSISDCAKYAKVAYRTAKIYIVGPGDPGIGMVPIRERYLKVISTVQETEEIDLATFLKEERKKNTKLIQGLHGEMYIAIEKIKQKIAKHNAGEEVESEMSYKDLVNSYDKAVRLMQHMYGGPDVIIQQDLSKDKKILNTLTPEQEIEYFTTGVLPKTIKKELDNLDKQNKK